MYTQMRITVGHSVRKDCIYSHTAAVFLIYCIGKILYGGENMNLKHINWRPVTICLALVFSIAGGMYVVDRTERSVAVIGQPQNDVIFILDAGHGAYALSIVA